ncbi:MAG TPA: hypothetical protein VIH52_01470 [Candidatus Nanoarchaeia archaeon]|nr:hypothetical protein [uncultured archaeon]
MPHIKLVIRRVGNGYGVFLRGAPESFPANRVFEWCEDHDDIMVARENHLEDVLPFCNRFQKDCEVPVIILHDYTEGYERSGSLAFTLASELNEALRQPV